MNATVDNAVPLLAVNPGFSTMCVSFQLNDRMTVLHTDHAGLAAIRAAIREAWTSGISAERLVCGSAWSFKLSGDPFGCIWFLNADIFKQARQMVCNMLQNLSRIGWRITASADLTARYDQSTLFFEKYWPEFSTLPGLPYLCIGLTNANKLQIINLPSQLEEPLKETIRSSWSRGIRSESKTDGTLEIKLFGKPWKAPEQQSIMARVLLQNIISTLHRCQWAYYCNVNLNRSADSLFFRYDPTIPPGESPPFCTISLTQQNRLHVINAPNEIVAMIRNVIESHGVIKQEKDCKGSWEFKLSGTPWYSEGEESVMARYLVLKILEAMQERGWRNIAAICNTVNRRITDKSVLIFQQDRPKPCPMMCLSLSRMDKFRLINMPPEMVELFKRTASWSLLKIQEENEMVLSFGSVCQMKMAGRFWAGAFRNVNDTVHSQSLLCKIIEGFRQNGWKLLLCADVSSTSVPYENGHYNPVDVHSMWFAFDPNACNPEPSPPANASQMPAHDLQPASYTPHEFNDPPPSYEEATGWQAYG